VHRSAFLRDCAVSIQESSSLHSQGPEHSYLTGKFLTSSTPTHLIDRILYHAVALFEWSVDKMHLAVLQAGCRGGHGSDREHSKQNYWQAVSGTVFHCVSTVTTVTTLWDARPWNRGSILGRGNTFFTSRKRSDRLWVQSTILRAQLPLSPGVNRAEHKADVRLICVGQVAQSV